MRLIDADALDLTPIDITDLPYDVCLMVYLEEDVQEAPTVQAVPIEEVIKIIEFEEKWLSQTRMSIRDIDIAFNAMKSKIKQIEGE